MSCLIENFRGRSGSIRSPHHRPHYHRPHRRRPHYHRHRRRYIPGIGGRIPYGKVLEIGGIVPFLKLADRDRD